MAAELSIMNTDELEKYFHVLTPQIGTLPSELESGLSIGVEVFTLSEGFGISPTSLQTLWRHSVRTGYLAALIAIHQQVDLKLSGSLTVVLTGDEMPDEAILRFCEPLFGPPTEIACERFEIDEVFGGFRGSLIELRPGGHLT